MKTFEEFNENQSANQSTGLPYSAGSSIEDTVTNPPPILRNLPGRPSIFMRTIYRLPNNIELAEVNDFNMKAEQVLNGFWYTIVGRGILDSENKQMIVNSIQKLRELYPENEEYKTALEKAKNISLKR